MLRSCMFRWNKTPKDISFAAQHNRHKENMVSLNTITLDTSYLITYQNDLVSIKAKLCAKLVVYLKKLAQ